MYTLSHEYCGRAVHRARYGTHPGRLIATGSNRSISPGCSARRRLEKTRRRLEGDELPGGPPKDAPGRPYPPASSRKARQQPPEKAEREPLPLPEAEPEQDELAMEIVDRKRAPSGTPTSTGTTTSGIRPCPVRSSGTSSNRMIRSSLFWASPPRHGSAPPGMRSSAGTARRERRTSISSSTTPGSSSLLGIKNLASRILSLAAKRIAADWHSGTAMNPSFLRPSSITSASPERATRHRTGLCVGETQGQGKARLSATSISCP